MDSVLHAYFLFIWLYVWPNFQASDRVPKKVFRMIWKWESAPHLLFCLGVFLLCAGKPSTGKGAEIYSLAVHFSQSLSMDFYSGPQNTEMSHPYFYVLWVTAKHLCWELTADLLVKGVKAGISNPSTLVTSPSANTLCWSSCHQLVFLHTVWTKMQSEGTCLPWLPWARLTSSSFSFWSLPHGI